MEGGWILECSTSWTNTFADDVVVLASTRQAAETAVRSHMDVIVAFGLNVSLPKIKVGLGVLTKDNLPLVAALVSSVTSGP